jgi:predicted TIM-barrel fold metal-dependent hydrolase
VSRNHSFWHFPEAGRDNEKMTRLRHLITSILILTLAGLASGQNAKAGGELPAELQSFAALDPIDVHVHLFNADPAFVDLLKRLHLHVLDIVIVNDKDKFPQGIVPRLKFAWPVIRASEGRAFLCTSFDPFQFGQPDFAANAVRQMEQDFAEGAIAVKIWKNVGMELKDQGGKWVMPDDPAFAPIYREIAARDKTLIAHLAEPDGCWQPPNAPSNNCKDHPDWYMYGRTDAPSKAKILAARDHLLEQYPKLRVVGAHLGSMESDVDQIAQRFDRYPNFAVDTAARVHSLALQPRDKIRAFFIKYQDRILYGTDLDALPGENVADAIHKWEWGYAHEWKYFATDETMEFEGRKVQGLKLPPTVLRKLYHDNAVHWIPSILGRH